MQITEFVNVANLHSTSWDYFYFYKRQAYGSIKAKSSIAEVKVANTELMLIKIKGYGITALCVEIYPTEKVAYSIRAFGLNIFFKTVTPKRQTKVNIWKR